jgi:hypothetical protein
VAPAANRLWRDAEGARERRAGDLVVFEIGIKHVSCRNYKLTCCQQEFEDCCLIFFLFRKCQYQYIVLTETSGCR